MKSSNKKGFYIRIALVIIVITIFLSYSNSFRGEFVFDDIYSIVKNPLITNWQDIRSIYNFAPSRFITNYSFTLNYQLSGLYVGSYHLVNLLIHISTSFVIFLLFRTILQSSTIPGIKKFHHFYFPLIIALIFAVHPIQTQAVAYISQRYASLAAFFYILAVFLYVKAATDRYNLLYFIALLIVQLAAFFTKENTFTLPLSLILIDLSLLNHFSFRQFIKRMKFILPSVILTVATYIWLFQPFSKLSVSISLPQAIQDTNITRSEYLFTQFNVVTTYIRLLFFPFNLNADYDYPISRSILNIPTLSSLLLIIFINISALWLFKRNRWLSFGIWFFL